MNIQHTCCISCPSVCATIRTYTYTTYVTLQHTYNVHAAHWAVHAKQSDLCAPVLQAAHETHLLHTYNVHAAHWAVHAKQSDLCAPVIQAASEQIKSDPQCLKSYQTQSNLCAPALQAAPEQPAGLQRGQPRGAPESQPACGTRKAKVAEVEGIRADSWRVKPGGGHQEISLLVDRDSKLRKT
eukprot:1159230-Pelagomonas_calceolata.AAC.6